MPSSQLWRPKPNTLDPSAHLKPQSPQPTSNESDSRPSKSARLTSSVSVGSDSTIAEGAPGQNETATSLTSADLTSTGGAPGLEGADNESPTDFTERVQKLVLEQPAEIFFSSSGALTIKPTLIEGPVSIIPCIVKHFGQQPNGCDKCN